jgi:competence protein ComEC
MWAPLLLVPHHGSASSSGEAFLEAVGAKTALCSVGWGNRFGQPSPAVVQRYRARGVSFFRTDLDGALLALPWRGAVPVYRFRDGDWLPETGRAP